MLSTNQCTNIAPTPRETSRRVGVVRRLLVSDDHTLRETSRKVIALNRNDLTLTSRDNSREVGVAFTRLFRRGQAIVETTCAHYCREGPTMKSVPFQQWRRRRQLMPIAGAR